MRICIAPVTRKDLHHPEASGYRPEEAFSLEAALRCMNGDRAWQSFEEGRKGVFRLGLWPDFTICDQDVFALGAAEAEGCSQLDDDLSG